MSRIGKITEDVVRNGHDKREVWQPKLSGAPLRSYLWWREETGNYRSQENFCHFWRVVLIWAPLLRLRRLVTPSKLRKLDGEEVLIAVMFLLVAAGIITLVVSVAGSMWPAIGAWAILAAPAAVAGVFACIIGLIVGSTKVEDAVKDYRHQKRMNAPAPAVVAELKKAPVQNPKQRRFWPAIVRAALFIGRPIGRVVSAIWEYVVLVAQVVRVKKWKICPIVEIPVTTTS